MLTTLSSIDWTLDSSPWLTFSTGDMAARSALAGGGAWATAALALAYCLLSAASLAKRGLIWEISWAMFCRIGVFLSVAALFAAILSLILLRVCCMAANERDRSSLGADFPSPLTVGAPTLPVMSVFSNSFISPAFVTSG